MSKFQWRTDDNEALWRDKTAPLPTAARPRGGWLILLLLVAAVGGGAYTAVNQVQQRTQSTIRTIQADVLTSHELAVQAAVAQDIELFTNLLSGRDAAWSEAQIGVFRQHLLYNRPQLGLTTAEIRASDPTITLAPDLTEAAVSRAVRYTDLTTGQPITLQQTSLYRLGAERWLIVPLSSSATWGAEATYQGEWLVANYPEVDTAVVPILQTIDAQIGRICGWFDMVCPADMRLAVSLVTSPQSLLATPYNSAGKTPLTISERYILPAPLLLGQPTDQAGQQALARFYTQALVGNALERGLLTRWGHSPERYDWLWVLRQQQLGLIPTPNIPVVPDATVPQAIAALCLTDTGQDLLLYQPSPDQPAVQPLSNGRMWATMAADASQTYLALRETTTTQTEVVQWASTTRELVPLITDTNAPTWLMEWQPALAGANHLRLSHHARTYHTILAIPTTCSAANCLVTPSVSDYHPTWSPDGQHTLLLDSEGQLFLGDAAGNPVGTAVGRGRSPFWLSNEQYGYVEPKGLIVSRLGAIGATSLQPVVGPAELMAAVPEANRPASLSLSYAMPMADAPNHILLLGVGMAADGNPTQQILFDIRLGEGPPHLLFQARHMELFAPSPTGQQVAALWLSPSTGAPQVEIVNLTTAASHTIILPATNMALDMDWSADGRWLVATAAGQPYVIEANTGTLYRLPLSGCFQTRWMGSMSNEQ